MKRASLALAIALASSSASAAQETPGVPDTVETRPDPQPDPPKTKTRFGAKLAGGATYRTLYSSSLTGGTIDLGLGAELAPGALYGTVGIVLGSTKYGLNTQMYSFGSSWEFHIDRVRLGAGLQAGYLQISRITQPDHPMGAVFVGVHLSLTVDLFAASHHALYLGARLSGDSVSANQDSGAFAVGPTAFAGLRF